MEVICFFQVEEIRVSRSSISKYIIF